MANLLVGGTGLVLAWMIWGVTPDDPYAVVNHPAQPAFKAWHVVLAPVLTLCIGALWQQHAWAYFRTGVRKARRSGLAMLALALPMILSGVALQVSVELATRNAWLWVHVITSGLWLFGMAAHVWRHWRRTLRRD